VFQQAGVPFFEGCLIVEVHDHRKRTTSADPHLSQYKADGRRERPSDTSLYYLREGGRYGFHYTRYGGHSHPSNEDTALGPDGVEVYRIVLRPSDESLWNDLRMMDARAGGLWSDEDALAIEAQIVNLTAPPLCLTPDPHVTRIANLMLSSTVPPSFQIGSLTSEPYKSHSDTGHRLNSIEREQAKSEDVRREQVMHIMKDGWKSDSMHSSRDGTHHGASFMPKCVLPFLPSASRVLTFCATGVRDASRKPRRLELPSLLVQMQPKATQKNRPVRKRSASRSPKIQSRRSRPPLLSIQQRIPSPRQNGARRTVHLSLQKRIRNRSGRQGLTACHLAAMQRVARQL